MPWPNVGLWQWSATMRGTEQIQMVAALREADGGAKSDADYAAMAQRYTIALQGEDRIAFAADCNRGGAGLTHTDTRIAMGLLMMTRAYCGDTSLSDDFAMGLQQMTQWAVRGGVLYLSDDAGVQWLFVPIVAGKATAMP